MKSRIRSELMRMRNPALITFVEMESSRVCRPVVTDSHHLNEEQDPDPHISEKLDPDPHWHGTL